MNIFHKIMQFLNTMINILTDWVLIVIGLLLMVKAMLTIDVLEAKILVSAVGVLLFGFGLWYRHRRLKRHRQ